MGRAARNAQGKVIMYADSVTDSMREAMDETARRRRIQIAFNEEHGIVPKTIKKSITDVTSFIAEADETLGSKSRVDGKFFTAAGGEGERQGDAEEEHERTVQSVADELLALPKQEVDIIYLCSPNNPTGAAMNKNQLKLWVDWAREHGSVILFDAAYEAFITDGDIPHSIFELDGAKECAIEFRSFSKTAGFTGVRCAYTVIPRELTRDGVSLNALWARRQATRFNGVSYITQRAAEAVYSDEGRRQIKENISCYLGNAKAVADGLESVGIRCFGGRNSPYIWFEVPNGLTSWQMFDRLLSSAQVIGTPGSGFGRMGEGYFRLTAFAEPERTLEAVKRIKNGLG